MQRQKATFPIAVGQYNVLKQRMLNWGNQFGILLFLDSNSYPDKYGRYECLMAAGSVELVFGDTAEKCNALYRLYAGANDWLFGHICYDYKNALERKLSSSHTAKFDLSQLQFFRPQIVAYIDRQKQKLTVESLDVNPSVIYEAISAASPDMDAELPHLRFNQTIDKESYLATIARLRQHIADGDCYEINFCNEGYCENAAIDPLSVFQALNKLSPAPFASYYRTGNMHMMSASPERYIRKDGGKLIAQPIKGTARRGKNQVQDELIKQQLQNSIKDRAENVMIVDLMRNDLARCCEVGSVNVDELFGIYSFPQVHQMISTVSGTLKEDVLFTDALKSSFPMGSMTGAPKIKVMELIEHYEQSRRELFSGTVGYITPDGDFDFNVIIRSLFYNAKTQYLSYQTGGAITYDSSPEQEWEEMRLKAWALERVFQHETTAPVNNA